jgi:glycosyltransferase involved in cell wall biosynthesis
LRWAWKPTDLNGFLAGTQEWLLLLACAMKRRGHMVTIWWDGEELEWGGIKFRNRRFFDQADQIFISWNGHNNLPNRVRTERMFLWTNEPKLPNVTMESWDIFDAVIVNSRFQKSLYEDALKGLKAPEELWHKVIVSYPGIDPEEFSLGTEVGRDPNLALYASSWDRGLKNLIGNWPNLKRQFANLRLIVTYSPSFMKKVSGQWTPVPEEWKRLGIEFLEMDRLEMGKAYRRASYLLYPCTGTEMFCLSVWKAQYAGCIPITTNRMALSETVMRGVAVPMSTWLREASFTIGNERRKKELSSKFMNFWSWDDVAQNYERMFENEPAKA